MVLDTSAVVACLANEPDSDPLKEAILQATECRMSAFNVFECRVVLDRKFGAAMVREFELLLVKAEVVVDAFDEEQAKLASRAYIRYGKGTGHPARLNLGDCAAYALAMSLHMPLLFKGDDFSRTDVPPVVERCAPKAP